MDSSLEVVKDTHIKRWVLGADPVLVQAVATAIGMKNLVALASHFMEEEQWLCAAKIEAAIATRPDQHVLDAGGEDAAHGRAAALALIEEHSLAELTDEAQQLVSSSSPTPHPTCN